MKGWDHDAVMIFESIWASLFGQAAKTLQFVCQMILIWQMIIDEYKVASIMLSDESFTSYSKYL